VKASRNGILPVIPNFDVFLFSISSGAFLYFLEHEPESIKPSFVSFMKWYLSY